MSDYDDGWERDKDGFWTKDGEQIAPWQAPYADYPVDYSAEHDQDRDNFLETDERETPPHVKKLIEWLSVLIVVALALGVVALIFRAITWLVF